VIIIFTERCNFIAGEEFGVYVMYGRLGRVLLRKACFYQAFLQKKRMHGGLYFLYVYKTKKD
jgi:hypothetical protein